MDSSTHAEAIHETPSEESLRAGHEVRDVNIRVLLWLGAAVLSVIAIVLVVLWLLANQLESSATRADPELSPLTETDPGFAAPRLQSAPVHDYREYQRQQQVTLESYGWIDREKQAVRLPVLRAMELILEQGLPEPAAQPESEDDSGKETSDQGADP